MDRRTESGPLYRAVEFVAVAAFAVMLVATFLQVVFRYLLPFPLMWTEELARLMAVFVTYFGSVVAWMLRGHIRVDFLVERMPAGVRRALAVVIDVLLAWFALSFAYGCYLMMHATWATSAASMPWFRMAYLYAGVGVAVLLLTALILVDLARSLAALLRRGDGAGRTAPDGGE